jgi:hypothetical protein
MYNFLDVLDRYSSPKSLSPANPKNDFNYYVFVLRFVSSSAKKCGVMSIKIMTFQHNKKIPQQKVTIHQNSIRQLGLKKKIIFPRYFEYKNTDTN